MGNEYIGKSRSSKSYERKPLLPDSKGKKKIESQQPKMSGFVVHSGQGATPQNVKSEDESKKLSARHVKASTFKSKDEFCDALIDVAKGVGKMNVKQLTTYLNSSKNDVFRLDGDPRIFIGLMKVVDNGTLDFDQTVDAAVLLMVVALNITKSKGVRAFTEKAMTKEPKGVDPFEILALRDPLIFDDGELNAAINKFKKHVTSLPAADHRREQWEVIQNASNQCKKNHLPALFDK